MKFIYGLPPSDPFPEEKYNAWDSLQFHNKHLVLGLLTGFVLTLITEQVIRFTFLEGAYSFTFVRHIYLLLLIVPAHEGFHLLLLPGYKNISAGLYLRKMIVYFHTGDILTRSRFLTVSLAPLVLLTLTPLLLLSVYPHPLLGHIALYNLIGSGGDLVSAARILKLPRHSLLKMNGYELLVKPVR